MIRLIATDIDGCLLPGGTDVFDLHFFKILQQWQERANQNPRIPPITFCTGRPSPFCEALGRLINCSLPVICEHGGVMYNYHSGSMQPHPSFDKQIAQNLAELTSDVKKRFLQTNRPIAIEPGKITEITLITYPPLTVDDIWEEAREFLDSYDHLFYLTRTPRVITFGSRLLNKGVGLKWLADTLNIQTSEIAGFGDAMPDITFLERVELSGCPSNAVDEVKNTVNFTAPSPDQKGFLEFLNEIEKLNCLET